VVLTVKLLMTFDVEISKHWN